MDEPDALPPSPAQSTEPTAAADPVPARAPIRWRHDLLAGLVAGAAFMLLTTLAGMIGAEFVWLACIVFLPAGMWVGRRSGRPWADGAVYSLAATLLVALILLGRGFLLLSMAAPLLVLPQGFLGAWMGARLWPAQGPPQQE